MSQPETLFHEVLLSEKIPYQDRVIEQGVWSIRQQLLHGGKQEGSVLLLLSNGVTEVAVIPTRGMGIAWAKSGDVQLGWQSPVKEIVHPSFMNLESRNGLGWLEGFNEWMCRCGLEWSGHPGPDTFIDNVGAEQSMMLTLHGKIANIPASALEVFLETRKGVMCLVASGVVHERLFHGPKLRLKTEIVLPLDQAGFSIEDTVENHSACIQEMQMLYHCNFGVPLLEKGARLIAPVKHNEPFNQRAADGLGTFDVFEGPVPGFVEQVYCINLQGDAEGNTGVLLHNAAGDLGASLSFSVHELPCFTLWKNTASLEDGYVCGLEPGTSFPRNRSKERAAGRVPVLQPGTSRSFTVEVGLHRDAAEVQEKKKLLER